MVVKWFIGICALLAALLVACAPPPEESVVELAAGPITTATPLVIYVTPTPVPTTIPTYVLLTPTVTPLPPTTTPPPTLTPDTERLAAECQTMLAAVYETAGQLCLGKPRGYFCNGGLPPRALPAGPVGSALSVQGALVEADLIDSVQTAPLPSNNSGGLLWLRLESIQLDAFALGEVRLNDLTPPDSTFPAWQSFTVNTIYEPDPTCPGAPMDSLIVQSEYGQPTRQVINGVSIELDGTLAIQTHDTQTHFINLEGLAQITVLGQVFAVLAGQQLVVDYADTDYTIPSGTPQGAEPLQLAHIKGLPVELLDLPMELPQPGYAQTVGRVNLRAEPGLDGRLLYQIPAGEAMSILGTNPERDWLHLRLQNGETGWMKADLLTVVTSDIEAVYESTPLPPQRPGDLGHLATVISEQGGNLRTAPDVSFGVITTLPQGTQVDLIARSPYSPWVKVEVGTTVGWIALITLETQASISFLPVDYSAPLPPRPTPTPELKRGGGHAYPDPLGGQ